MLMDLFPRAHARYLTLPLLGPLLDGFALWLAEQGFADGSIRLRIRKAPALEERLSQSGLKDLGRCSKPQLLEITAGKSQADIPLSALVRSLAAFLHERGLLATTAVTPGQHLVGAYRKHLGEVRGLAASTQAEHCQVALDLLDFLDFDGDPAALSAVDGPQVEAFLRSVATTCGVSKLQNRASFLRSFLRFLAVRGAVRPGLERWVDSPRVPRLELPPRACPWESVRAFLAGISRDTAKGRRDYAMFLLMATYGLRTSEVAALRLDEIRWRAAEFRVQRPKVLAPLTLPLTDEVGEALTDYLRHARPPTAHRTVFLRMRRPCGPLSKAGIFGAFRSWQRDSALDRAGVGPHCLRHSLAMHLLRQNASVKMIGNLLGHRSLASTGTYLRIHHEHLRAAALDLPTGTEGGDE